MKRLAPLGLVVWMLFGAGLARGVEIELVPVGNPGNPPDRRYDPNGFGAVADPYLIGKYEVTFGQYREFLNAKAAVGDPHQLFNEGAFRQYGITRVGSGTAEDPWVYYPFDLDPTWDRRPVNHVTIWDAMRFINWLNNGQGAGDTESGAYAYLDDDATWVRQPGATYYLPSEDEWYKAAYYDPTREENGGYWEFPTRSDQQPSNDAPPGADLVRGSANYGSGGLTPVGVYDARPSTSYYGTYDQGGNLWEWNETYVIGTYFGLRGGSFDNVYGLEAAHRDSYPATFENPIMGFRVMAVPEPAGARLWGLATALGAALAWCCRRRQRGSALAGAARQCVISRQPK